MEAQSKYIHIAYTFLYVWHRFVCSVGAYLQNFCIGVQSEVYQGCVVGWVFLHKRSVSVCVCVCLVLLLHLSQFPLYFPPPPSCPTMQINLIRRRTPVLLQVYLPSGLFVVVSWISFIVPPEVVPGRKRGRAGEPDGTFKLLRA